MQFLAGIVDVDGTLRDLWASLCQLIYRLMAFLYELFINVASVKLLTQNNIKPIYQRVTLILAIIMVFYVTLEVVKYVVEPDKMTDKEKGAANIVKNMIIVVLLIAFVPFIFEKAYDLQNSLIKNQVLSKVILGKENVDMDKVGKEFSAQMFGLFYKYDNEFWESQGKSEEDVAKCDGVVCASVVKMNISTLSTQGNLPYIHMGLNTTEKITLPTGNKKEVRVITFDGLFAVVVGVFVCYVLLLYCIDAGVRVAQLLFLQVIAPIPIIGYLAPKKEGIFQKWVKQCITTYLDLFIRITLICFILLIVQEIGNAYHSQTLVNGIGSNVSNDMRTFIYIAIIMGLLLFAQKAPKMLQELFPKMGAASGNFGLKAGERVAPAAARAIGAGLGATRLLTGAFARGFNTFRRNKQIRERTGKTRREQREEIRKNREEMRAARGSYKDALGERRRAHKDLRTGKISQADYEKKQEEVNKKRDTFVEKQSNYADSQNSKYRSVALNALGGAVGGAYRGMKSGAGAKKLEEVGKKVKEGYAADKKAVNAREQWLDSGGYSNVRRTIAGVEQSIGMTTPAGKTERAIHVYDSQIKANERLIATESDVKAKEDAAKDRSASKIEAGEQKTVIPAKQTFTIKGLDGVSDIDVEMPPVEYDDEGRPLPITTSMVFAHYREKATRAKNNADAKAQALQNLEIAKLRAGTSWSDVDESALRAARDAAKEAAKEVTITSDAQGKVKKKMQEYAITDILKGRQDYQDGVLRQKVDDMKTSLLETTRDEKTRNAVAAQLDAMIEIELKPEKKANLERIKKLYEKIYEEGNADLVTNFDDYDVLQTALINSASERTRENVEIKGSKSRLEASSNTDAQKSDDKATGGGGK